MSGDQNSGSSTDVQITGSSGAADPTRPAQLTKSGSFMSKTAGLGDRRTVDEGDHRMDDDRLGCTTTSMRSEMPNSG